MPSGDAQRVWFPEILAMLRSSWSETMSWDELANLCKHLTEVRKELRAARGIKDAVYQCRKCGGSMRSGSDRLSIRSALFALKKIGMLTETDLARLDRDWTKYRAANQLDRNGDKVSANCPCLLVS